jgi:hypothetical protein
MAKRYDILDWMRGRIAVAALAAAIVGVLGACGSNGTDPGMDAGPPADDGGIESATDEDTSVADAGTDAPADTKPDTQRDASTGYCATLSPAPKFCDDFDDGNLTDGWSVQNVAGGAVMDLDISSFTSAPYAMAIVTPAINAGQFAPAALRAERIAPARHVTYSFSAYFVTDPAITKGALAIAGLDVRSAGPGHYFTLYLRDDPQDGVSTPAAVFEEIEGATTTRFPLAALPPMGAWTRIVIDVDLDAAKANVTFGGVKVVDDVTIGTSGGAEATFRLGAVYNYGPADMIEARFDDVVVDF